MDFRLRVFESVARHKSFTRAAKEMKISQPAISKHIQELESLYRVQLFDRNGTKIKISEAGELLLSHTERILDAFLWLEYDMNHLTNHVTGELRIGASSSVAQYILPPIIARFIKKHSGVKISFVNGSNREIESALLKKKIDLAMMEGENSHSDLVLTPFFRDELVAVCSTKGTLKEYNELTFKQFTQTPVVIRENGSQTLEIIENELKRHRLKLSDLNIVMQLGSAESIKLFLENSDCLGIVSARSISAEITSGRFKVIPVSNLNLARTFQFIQHTGASSSVVEDFIRFAKREIHT